MELLKTILVVLQIISAIGVIALVLIQQGKGADMGAAFGGGSSGGLFGAAGSANFLSRVTAVFATIFFLSTLGITFFSSTKSQNAGVLSGTSAPVVAPAAEVPVPATAAPGSPAAPVTGSGQSVPR
jgi:preprotein translocase subunit SecG